MFYVYVWRDASGVPFYVGKGSGNRAFDTSPTARSADFLEVHSCGGCTVEVVDYFIHESQSHAHEVELIARFGRQDNGTGTLVNKTDGGEGLSGYIVSTETRAKLSWVKSHPTTETRNRMRAAQQKIWSSPARRKKHSELLRTPEISDARNARLRRMPPRKDNSSGFKGVARDVGRNKWTAFIKLSAEHRFLGRYKTPEEAARAYDKAAYAAWGSDCYLNFPNEINGGELAA